MFNSAVAQYLPYVLRGIPITLELMVLANILMLICAFGFALMRLSRYRLSRWVSLVVVEFFRGSSVVIQMFWAFYVLPFFGLSPSPTVAAVAVIGLNAGSYASEVVRNAFLEVPAGQHDAAFAVGYSRWQTSRLIVFPQAIGLMIAPLTNTVIDVIKVTSVASLILLPELTFRAFSVRATTGASLELFGLIFIIYLALSLLVSRGSHFIESRHSKLLAIETQPRRSLLWLRGEQV